MNKQTLFTKVEEEGVSDDEEEEDEIILEGRNEILFLAQEKEEGTVDLESELIAALEEIENLKSLNEKQEQNHQIARNQLAKRLSLALERKEEEVNSLKEKLNNSSLSQKFQQSSLELNNLLLLQKHVGDKSGIGYTSVEKEHKEECSLN